MQTTHSGITRLCLLSVLIPGGGGQTVGVGAKDAIRPRVNHNKSIDKVNYL